MIVTKLSALYKNSFSFTGKLITPCDSAAFDCGIPANRSAFHQQRASPLANPTTVAGCPILHDLNRILDRYCSSCIVLPDPAAVARTVFRDDTCRKF